MRSIRSNPPGSSPPHRCSTRCAARVRREGLVRRVGLVAAAVVTLPWTASPAAAQGTIASDRPGIGSGATVLAAGIAQLESGLSYAGAPGSHALSLGEALVRVGAPGLEVELFGSSFVVRRGDAPGADAEGIGDVGLGVKVPLASSVADVASLSLQGILTTPTGADAFSSGEWVPALNALADLSLGSGAGIGVNVGYRAGPGALDDALSMIVTPGLSLDDGWGVFAGWAGSFSGSGDVHYAEGGATRLVGDDLQLDINGGWAPGTDEWFLGGGVAVRWGAR